MIIRLNSKNGSVMQAKIILILLFSITLISCRLAGVKGNRDLITENRKIDDFNNIEISGQFFVDIEVGQKLDIVIIAESNLVKLIKTNVKKKTLYISSLENLRPTEDLKILISVPKLNGIECSGFNDIVAKGVDSHEFDIDLSGAGSIKIAGITKFLNIDISGAADLQAKKLITKNISINVSGAANAEIYASNSCNADISGVGYIELYGNAENVYTDISNTATFERK